MLFRSQHFESIDIGRVRSDTTGPQILVDISRPGDRSPLWVLDEQGRQLGEIVAASSRHHDLIEWGQDGTSAILLASARGVFDGHGKRLATLAIDDGDQVRDVMAADVTGDGVPEIVLTTMTGNAVYLYRLPSGVTPKTRVGLGTPANFTLY